jgi:hypothetical protein
MIKTITEWDFVNSFDEMNRSENFSVEGRKALFELLEEVNPDFELDVIAICCEFSEYEDLNELKQEYSHLLEGEEFEDDDEVLDFFMGETTLIQLKGGGIIINSNF